MFSTLYFSEAKGRLSNASSQLNKSFDADSLNRESLAALQSEVESLETECQRLRVANTKLLKDQVCYLIIILLS